MPNFFSSRRKTTKAASQLGDTSVPRSTYDQIAESTPEAKQNAGARAQGFNLHRLQSANIFNDRTGGLSYAELASRERGYLSLNDAEALDQLYNLVKGQKLGGLYNSAFCKLCDDIEVVFLGRLYICNAFRAERRDTETTNVFNKMRTFHELLNKTGALLNQYASMSAKKVEIKLQELRSEAEEYIKMLTMTVSDLDSEFLRNVLNPLVDKTFTKRETSSRLVLEYIIEIVRDKHPGLQHKSRNAVLDGDLVAEPEGGESILPTAGSTSGIQPGHVTQIMDRQLVEEPQRRQSTMQHPPTMSAAVSSRSNSQHSPLETRAANGRVTSQHPASSGHSASQTRHTMSDVDYRAGDPRNPKTSKTAPPRNHPTEDPPQRRSTRNSDALEETRADKPSTRRSSRKSTYSDDRDEYTSERRRESGGDRPHRSSSGSTSNKRAPRRTTRWESPIREETESVKEQSSSEEDKLRRHGKKAYTADSERRRRPTGRGRETRDDSHAQYDAYTEEAAAPYPSQSNRNLGHGVLRNVMNPHHSQSSSHGTHR